MNVEGCISFGSPSDVQRMYCQCFYKFDHKDITFEYFEYNRYNTNRSVILFFESIILF